MKFEYEIGMNMQGFKGGYLDFYFLILIFDWILKGLFDLELVKLFFWLVCGGVCILFEYNWEVIKYGFEQIMNMESWLGIYVFIFFDIFGVFKKEYWLLFLFDEKMKWVKEIRWVEMFV